MTLKPIFVDIQQLPALLSLSKSTIELEQRLGRFQKPRQLSDRRVGYLLSEVEEWAAQRPVSDLPPPPNTNAPKPRRQRARGEAGPALPASHQAA